VTNYIDEALSSWGPFIRFHLNLAKDRFQVPQWGDVYLQGIDVIRGAVCMSFNPCPFNDAIWRDFLILRFIATSELDETAVLSL
jgi:hypothetical protein